MSRLRWQWACLLVVLIAGVLATDCSAQVYQSAVAPPGYPALGSSGMGFDSQASMPRNETFPITQTAYAQGKKTHKNKPLPPQIAKMPQAEEELEVIHHRSQLIITRSRISRWAIADPTVIDVLQFSPNEISVIGNQMGATHLTLWFEGEPITDPLIYRVEVIRDPNLENQQREDYGKLERQLQVLFPNSQVYLVPLTFRLVVKGQARDQEEAAQIMNVVRAEWMARNANWLGNGYGYGNVAGGAGWGGIGWGGNPWDWGTGFGNNWNNNNFVINMLEVPGEQMVMIHVRIAQLDRAQLRRFGIDINALLNGGRHVLTASVGGGAATSLSGIFENGELSVLLDWLESNRTAKIKAEPSVAVMNGTSASFISGGEFAVPTIVGVGGAQGTTTTFRGFGTSLIVTPTIIDRDLIRLRIVPEFSEINSNNTSGGVPGLNTRRVTTTVQLREGQTIALAGLFSHQSSAEITRIPLLGELPYIGPRIFNAKEAHQGETELLFLVTPEIIRPMEQDEVPPVPGFYVTHPNNHELYHYAMTEGAPDEGVYQLAPYGWGPGMGTEIGYRPHNPALGMYPPGPANGVIGASLQTGGFSFPGGAMPYGAPGGMAPAAPLNGGYSQPLTAPAAPAGTPTPIPDPSVRFAPNSSSPLLSRSSAEEIAAPPKSSWNPFKRFTTNPSGSGVQPAGFQSGPSVPGTAQPANYQAPRGRY